MTRGGPGPYLHPILPGVLPSDERSSRGTRVQLSSREFHARTYVVAALAAQSEPVGPDKTEIQRRLHDLKPDISNHLLPTMAGYLSSGTLANTDYP